MNASSLWSTRARVFRSVALLSLFVLAACGPPRRGERPEQVGADDTTLGTGDVFDIRVFGEEDLSATYRVAQDGTIDFPLIGRLTVVGLEPYVVADLVEERLREGQLLVDPQVSVFVQEYNSKRVAVLGAVESPGNFPMVGGLTVVQAIGLAGGFTALANRDGTTVTRRVSGNLRRYPVHVDAVMRGDEDDFRLQAQDIIYVPERVF